MQFPPVNCNLIQCYVIELRHIIKVTAKETAFNSIDPSQYGIGTEWIGSDCDNRF